MRAERHRTILAPMLCAAAAATTHAEVIAFQDFSNNTLVQAPLNGLGDNNADAATNASFGTIALGTFFDSGTGLAWTASYSNSPAGSGGPIVGNETGDVIGVVDDTTLAGPQPAPFNGVGNDLFNAGNRPDRWFHIDDADGLITLAFDPIDTSGFFDLSLSFLWAANSLVDWEPEDSFSVRVNGTTVFARVGEQLGVGNDIASFQLVDIDLSQFDGQTLNIAVLIENNGAGEDIGFSNLEVAGTLIPAPTTTACLIITTAFTTRRRRSH